MADRPTPGDDDEAAARPGVTVPPWLRSGPTPDTAVPPAAPPEPERGAGPEAAPAEPAPHRIRLGGPVTERAGGEPTAPAPPPRPEPAPAPPAAPSARTRLALLGVGGAVVLVGSALLGFALVRGASGPGGGADPAAGAGDCVSVDEPGHVAGDGPGSLDTAAGAVLAFDHAYYVERSAARAFEVVAPSSRMSEERLRTEGLDRLPEGTTHCVDVRELSPTLLDVTLTENRPGAGPVHIRQRVRVAQGPDGSWGIVSITPAG